MRALLIQFLNSSAKSFMCVQMYPSVVLYLPSAYNLQNSIEYDYEPTPCKQFPAKLQRLSDSFCDCVRAVASVGASGARPPHLKSVPPFHVWPPGCYIHPILYFKNVAPLLVFGPLCC